MNELHSHDETKFDSWLNGSAVFIDISTAAVVGAAVIQPACVWLLENKTNYRPMVLEMSHSRIIACTIDNFIVNWDRK